MDKSNPTRVPSSGIYLQPNLEGITGFDFVKVKSIIDSGYAETMRRMPEIRQKITARRTCDDVAALRNKFNNHNPPLLVDSVIVYDHNKHQKTYINRLFKGKRRPLSFTEVKRGYYSLVSKITLRVCIPVSDSTQPGIISISPCRSDHKIIFRLILVV